MEMRHARKRDASFVPVQRPTMAIRDDLYRKMISEREATEREARRAELRRWLLVLGVCLLWQVIGGATVVFAFTTYMDHDQALQVVWAGFGIAVAGTAITIALGAPKQDRAE